MIGQVHTIMYPQVLITLDIKSRYIFERFADGDSTMEETSNSNVRHILSYLNSPQGVDDAYAAAFNREDKSVF